MTLHIYPVAHQHDDQVIMASRQDLLSLREMIDSVLLSAESEYREKTFFCADGEGFTLHLLRVKEEIVQTFRLPYTDVVQGENKTNPMDIINLLGGNNV
jgi:hypothetical protein